METKPHKTGSISEGMRQAKEKALIPLEKKIQERIIKRYTNLGWMVIRLINTNKPGIPDLLLLKDGVARFIEVKRPGKKPRPLQEKRIEDLRSIGFQVDVIDN